MAVIDYEDARGSSYMTTVTTTAGPQLRSKFRQIFRGPPLPPYPREERLEDLPDALSNIGAPHVSETLYASLLILHSFIFIALQIKINRSP
ncbi:hypothetical protein PIB30_083494 [Stylosanthes scabra]|uniref:Uncharacterized protein n=1 Tax=Stylosanthes scabra TaxID=79078 RepID=A0ABU6ZQW5_9FABA|nr:hypothetical protein [Stylosanthes scabra]